MARARNIKPAFFQNEQLAEVGPWGRLLFIGLWTLADREGRLEDRPRRMKMQLFPADEVDVDVLLTRLQELGFILRYEVDGCAYIQVINFLKHQKPHRNEAQSVIPPPPTDETTSGQGTKDGAPRADALRPESLNTDSLNEESPLSESGGARRRALDLLRTIGVTTNCFDESLAANPELADARIHGVALAFVSHYSDEGRAPPDNPNKRWVKWLDKERQIRSEHQDERDSRSRPRTTNRRGRSDPASQIGADPDDPGEYLDGLSPEQRAANERWLAAHRQRAPAT